MIHITIILAKIVMIQDIIRVIIEICVKLKIAVKHIGITLPYIFLRNK